MSTNPFEELGFNLKDLTHLANLNLLSSDSSVSAKSYERFVSVLARRTRNHVYLLSDNPQARTGMVEKLAVEIGRGNVPEVLLKRRILMLEAKEVVETYDAAQIEEKLRSLYELLKKHDILLYIQDFHLLVTPGFAQLMGPYIQQYQIQFVGGTTDFYYDSVIKQYGSIERRFQSIIL